MQRTLFVSTHTVYIVLPPLATLATKQQVRDKVPFITIRNTSAKSGRPKTPSETYEASSE